MRTTTFAAPFSARDKAESQCAGCHGIAHSTLEVCCGERWCGKPHLFNGCLADHQRSPACMDPEALADRLAAAIDGAELARGGR